MGGDALAGLEEEVVEEELLVDRSRPPPLPPPVLPPLLCLMPLSSMPCPFPPVTSFHSCWSSAGLRPAAKHRQVKERGETKLHASCSGHKDLPAWLHWRPFFSFHLCQIFINLLSDRSLKFLKRQQ